MVSDSEHDTPGALTQALEVERKRADAAERAAADCAHHIAMLAHELRTAIGGINSMADLLAASSLDDMQSKQVAALRQSGGNLLSLVNNVLDNAKLRSGKMALDPVDADLKDFIAVLESGLAPRAGFKGLQSAVSIDGPLPAMVQVDLMRLRQIVDNLIDNAVKFTAQGGVQLRVSFEEGASATGLLHVTISDTGIGLTDEQVGRLFRPFAQADNTIARRFGGSGLGLAIVKQLVELMGGTIAVRSEPDKGSTFALTVPVNAVRWSRVEEAATSDASRTGAAAPLHVLIVEDNAVNQFLLSTLLDTFGMTFQIAGGGREGIGAYRRGQFDIVLMDIQMPVVDGIDAARAIRQIQQTTGFRPIVALTAQRNEDIAQAKREGLFDGHVDKPIDPARLAKAINTALDRPCRAASA